MAAVSAAMLLHPVSYSHSHYETEDESEFEECNTLTVLDYGNKKSHWMTPQYLSLQLRCSRLMMTEARQALRGHFREESRQNLQRLLPIDKETQTAAENSVNQTLKGNPNYSMDRLPAFLAVPIDDQEAVFGHLEESLEL